MDGDGDDSYSTSNKNSEPKMDSTSQSSLDVTVGESSNSLNKTTVNHSDDDLDYTTNYDSDLELDKGALQNDNQLPLVPTEFTSIQEAIQNLTAVFESRYGAQHAPFFQGSLLEAITEAFDSPGGGVEQRRPLAIYLHNDNAVAAHIFAQTVMSNVNVSNLLKCQFVLWAWDASLHDNKQSFFEWMDLANIGTIGNSIKMIPSSKYPLLIVLIKERGVIARADCIYGQDTAVMTTQKLIEALDQFQNIKQVDAEQERSRAERELFRREQSEEYHRGLAADKAKQEEQKRRKQLEQEEAEKRAQDEQKKQDHLNCLAKMLPAEPSAEDPQAITIRLRFPDGQSSARRFRDCENLDMLLVYAATLGYDSERYRIWTSDRPRKEIATLNVSKSFAQLNWTKREQLNVEEK